MQKLHFKYFFKNYLLLSLVLFWPFLKAASQDYFQQEVNYKINVTLNDRNHVLNGSESVEYINNSPDTLMFLYFHLWPNAYSNNNTALARQVFSMKGKGKLFKDEELKGYIDSLDFVADSNQVQWDLLQGSADICRIILNKPLKPGDTVLITTPFHVKIPKGVTSRLGHIGESYQISQWYPKPAVYDRSGWHQMPYLDQAEFYSEFGRFEVSITLPANYIVGATGNLQNEEEKRFLDIQASDSVSKKAIYFRDSDFPPSSKEMKTLTYTENNIHDFAWFADKRFHVLKGSVHLPDSEREVTTWVMFTNKEAYLWWNAISYVNSAVSYFSKCIGDYPYNVFTAVQSPLNSGAGMEYPGLTVIGLAGDPYMLDQVIAHEICHSWFYSAIGSDERRFPFMDESVATYYESRYLNEKYPDKKLWELSFRNRKLARFLKIDEIPVQRIQEMEWLVPARRNQERPIDLAATDYNYDNYGSIIYYKAAQGFNYLRAYLGDSHFDAIMHDYYKKWKNKHPQPEDLRAVFESNTTKDLAWFFDDFLGTTKRLDYKIVRSENRRLLIKNKGELNGPLSIKGTKGDTVRSELWEDGFEGKKWIDVPWTDNSEILIDPDHAMLELFRLNNNIRTSGIWRKADPFRLRFLYTVEEPENRTLIYFPALNWNRADGLMAGVALNNGTLIPKPVEYFLIPFYTFRNQGLTGYGRISLNITPYNNPVRLATFTLEGTQFGFPGNQNYRKAKIGLDLFFRSGNKINPINHKVFGYFMTASDLAQIELLMPAKMRSYFQFGYNLERSGIVNPFNILVSSESGKSFQKTSLDMNYMLSYYGRNNGLGIRFFAGAMLKNDSANPFYSLSASGRSGSEQYLYEGLYPDRFGEFATGFWSRQMDRSEGGLASPVNDALGYSRWLLSLSFTSSLPEKISWIPVKPFLSVLLNDHSAGTSYKSPLFFETGFKAGIWNFFEIYFPLLVSDNIESLTGSIKERIRFVFQLDLLNPLRLK
jgi:Peptidase family M1 domain